VQPSFVAPRPGGIGCFIELVALTVQSRVRASRSAKRINHFYVVKNGERNSGRPRTSPDILQIFLFGGGRATQKQVPRKEQSRCRVHLPEMGSGSV
jgi:hypothetical protein